MDLVGYKRVNKKTGKEVSKEHIVKGIQHEKDKYILLSEEEIRSAHPKSTQTIDIFSFVKSSDIPQTNPWRDYTGSDYKKTQKISKVMWKKLGR